jgi:hypothetical protein
MCLSFPVRKQTPTLGVMAVNEGFFRSSPPQERYMNLAPLEAHGERHATPSSAKSSIDWLTIRRHAASVGSCGAGVERS